MALLSEVELDVSADCVGSLVEILYFSFFKKSSTLTKFPATFLNLIFVLTQFRTQKQNLFAFLKKNKNRFKFHKKGFFKTIKNRIKDVELWKTLIEYLYEEKGTFGINESTFDFDDDSNLIFILKKNEHFGKALSSETIHNEFEPEDTRGRSPRDAHSTRQPVRDSPKTNLLVLSIIQKVLDMQKLLGVSPEFVLNFVVEALDSFGFSGRRAFHFLFGKNKAYFVRYFMESRRARAGRSDELVNFFGVFGADWVADPENRFLILPGIFSQHSRTRLPGKTIQRHSFDDFFEEHFAFQSHLSNSGPVLDPNALVSISSSAGSGLHCASLRSLARISRIIDFVAPFLQLREINQLVRLNKHCNSLLGHLTLK